MPLEGFVGLAVLETDESVWSDALSNLGGRELDRFGCASLRALEGEERLVDGRNQRLQITRGNLLVCGEGGDHAGGGVQ